MPKSDCKTLLNLLTIDHTISYKTEIILVFTVCPECKLLCLNYIIVFIVSLFLWLLGDCYSMSLRYFMEMLEYSVRNIL